MTVALDCIPTTTFWILSTTVSSYISLLLTVSVLMKDRPILASFSITLAFALTPALPFDLAFLVDAVVLVVFLRLVWR